MKYLKVSVTRTEGTDLYISVPDDFEPTKLMRIEYRKKIVEQIEATIDDMTDWDKSEWEETVEVQSVGVVSEKEAKDYACGEIVPIPASASAPVREIPQALKDKIKAMQEKKS